MIERRGRRLAGTHYALWRRAVAIAYRLVRRWPARAVFLLSATDSRSPAPCNRARRCPMAFNRTPRSGGRHLPAGRRQQTRCTGFTRRVHGPGPRQEAARLHMP